MKEKYKGLKEKWADPKEHAKMSLTMYGIFFLVVFLLIYISNRIASENVTYKNVTPENSVGNIVSDKLSLFDMEKKLISNEYSFNYEVQINDVKTKIYGTNNLGDVLGYKENKNGITKFKIESEVVYELKMDEEIVADNFFDTMNVNFLFPDKLFDMLKTYTMIKKTTDTTRNFLYEMDNLIIEIISKDNTIIEIDISNGTDKYKLSFN